MWRCPEIRSLLAGCGAPTRWARTSVTAALLRSLGMANDADDVVTSGTSRVRELLDDNARLREDLARLQGQVEVLRERLSAQDAADEHHRVELETARAETADALAHLKEAQTRVEEWRRRVADAEKRRTLAERQRRQAEQDRTAVIAALGRRARKHLDTSG